MKPNSFRRNTCRLCNSSRVEVAVPINPSPIADAYVPENQLSEAQALYPLDLYLCRECGHVQLLDVVDPEVLFRDYIYTTSISLGLVEHFRKYADDVSARFPLQMGSLVLDIGSNDGTLLKFFKSKGLRVLGVDPAVNIARQASESGIETLPSFFSLEAARQIKGAHGSPTLITANNVFAHSDTMGDIIDGVRELLSSDGLFVFEVSYLLDIVEKLLFDTVYHEHLCYHSIKPLDLFFKAHGLELVDIQRIPSKGGSIRGFAQHCGGPYAASPTVSQLLAEETRIGLAEPKIFQEFTKHLDCVKSELLSIVRKLKAEGTVIAGYGASATVTTLTYNFEIGPHLDFLVDDNKSRQGLFSPGHHLPVLPPQALVDRKPGSAVILAWQYAEPIVNKNKVFLAQGGQFILPMPQVKVINNK